MCVGQRLLWAFCGSFSFVSRLSELLLSFLLIPSGPWGFYGLFLAGGLFLGFWVSFLLFHGFLLVCFALVSIHLRGFLGSVFVPGSVCFEPLGSSFVSRAFFFASSLLCFYLLIALLILCAVLYSFPISYLSLRFSCF